jgi:hypothetical protein
MLRFDPTFGSVLLDINGTTLTVRNLQAGGLINDTFAIVKIMNGGNDPHDINGNGTADIVWRNMSSGAVAVWLMNGTTIASTGFPAGAPLEWEIAGVGDLNGDGKGDLVWRNTGSGAVAVWLMNGATVTSTGFPGSASMDWEIR